jgi:hypothetical protein
MLKTFRTVSASLFIISIVLWGFSLFGENPFAYAGVSFLLWGSLGAFCFTEGFLFDPPKRTKVNIYGARFFFVASMIIVIQIVYYVLSGQIAGNAA